MDERFSAYLDGETSPEETEAVWSQLGRDPALRGAWGRQHWLRTVLRDADACVPYDPDFAVRVGRTLDLTASPENIGGAFATPRRRWRAAASLAAAASLVAVVLLATDPIGEESGAARLIAGAGKKADATPDEPAEAAADAAPAVEEPDPATRSRPATENRRTVTVAESPRNPDHWSVSDPEVENRLNGYLLEHNGLARGYGMSGATPGFLRVATYGRSAQR